MNKQERDKVLDWIDDCGHIPKAYKFKFIFSLEKYLNSLTTEDEQPISYCPEVYIDESCPSDLIVGITDGAVVVSKQLKDGRIKVLADATWLNKEDSDVEEDTKNKRHAYTRSFKSTAE